MTLISNGDVVTPDRVIRDGALLVEGSRISAVGTRTELEHAPKIDQQIDAGGGIIAPGFIDLQLNGANGRLLTAEPSAAAVLAMSEVLPRFGCSAVLPTAITAPVDRLDACARAVAAASEVQSDGARILGLHLEGPFINPERHGAHHAPFIISPSIEVLSRLWSASDESLRLLTLAPEMPGAIDVIDWARRQGITVAIGHSNATPDRINTATEHGASLATHLFNAMSQLGSREPGTVGGVLANDRLYASVIADGVHVSPLTLGIAVRAKGVDRIVLITDGMPPLGTPAEAFTLDGETIQVRNGACYRPDGVLAGSVLTMDRAVRIMHQAVGIPLPDAIRIASVNPARVLGIEHQKGSLEPGKDADVVIIDQDVNVALTMIEGRICYRSSGP